MALDSYSALQTSIASWLMRPGDSNITAIAPDLITLFEEEARDRLKSRFAEATATATTIAGTATVTLPADFMEAREVYLTDAAGDRATLDYMTPEQLDAEWPIPNDCAPFNFTIEGTQLRLGPVPDAAYTVKMLYQQGIVALSNDQVLAGDSHSGRLFQVALRSNAAHREIRELNVAGGPLPTNDGLLLDRGVLLVMQNSDTGYPNGVLDLVVLHHGGHDGVVVQRRTDPTFRTTSTIARAHKRYLIVNADFATNTTPFTVSGLAR